jgi:hypothetical protein
MDEGRDMTDGLRVRVLELGIAVTPAPGIHGVCPQAPSVEMQNFADELKGWVAWGVLSLILIAAIVSIGSILAGRIFAHPHGSRYGAIGLTVTVICAVLYVTVPAVLAGIIGSGC